MIRSIFTATAGILASIRLTVLLLVLSILLVFAATLDQVQLGVWGVQEKYFHAWFVLAQVPGTQLSLPVFPGGYLLGGVLLANLLAAHFTRFRLAWKNCGIWLTHVGLILLLIGEGVSGLWQRDSQMRLDLGQTKRYAESFRETELAVSDVTDPVVDDVVAIPSVLVEEKALIQHPKLPFTLRATAF
ncbi:MAG: ResB protein required for cytochrome C biosynthesis, partial [Pseudomonadota bacterium]